MRSSCQTGSQTPANAARKLDCTCISVQMRASRNCAGVQSKGACGRAEHSCDGWQQRFCWSVACGGRLQVRRNDADKRPPDQEELAGHSGFGWNTAAHPSLATSLTQASMVKISSSEAHDKPGKLLAAACSGQRRYTMNRSLSRIPQILALCQLCWTLMRLTTGGQTAD